MEATDLFWMRRALAEAERGRGVVEPNPMVGAALARDGRLISVGHHGRFGGPHAEVVALDAARGDTQGATLYVTLEPCCHTGKTPPCTDAILRAGIARVVAAVRDPFPPVQGDGLARLRDAGLAVTLGVAEADARKLLGPYLKRITTGRPFVTAKWAMTLDGKTACASGDSRWISGPRSRSLVHETRGRMDAILVGIGTALADDPELTARPPGPRTPIRVVIDSAARLPLESRLVRSAREAPVVVATTHRAPDDRRQALEGLGCEVWIFSGPDRVPIPDLLARLGDQGATNVLVEGGGHLLGSFLDADQIDAVEVYVAPILAGGAAVHTALLGAGVSRMAQALRLHDRQLRELDGDLQLTGRVSRPWLVPEDA